MDGLIVTIPGAFDATLDTAMLYTRIGTSGAFSAAAMTDGGSGAYTADLPAALALLARQGGHAVEKEKRRASTQAACRQDRVLRLSCR